MREKPFMSVTIGASVTFKLRNPNRHAAFHEAYLIPQLEWSTFSEGKNKTRINCIHQRKGNELSTHKTLNLFNLHSVILS